MTAIDNLLDTLEAEVFDYEPDWHLLRLLNDEWKHAVDGNYGSYLKWLACLVRAEKPQHILEIGNQEGVSTLMMYKELQPSAHLTSVDLFPNLAYIPPEVHADPRVTFLFGDSADPGLANILKPCPADLCFIDSDHFYRHKKNEWPNLKPVLAEDALVVCDDIHLNDMDRWWDELPFQKYDLTSLCHIFGFGLFRYNARS